MPMKLTEAEKASETDDGAEIEMAGVPMADATKAVVKMQCMLRGLRAREKLPPGFGKWVVESSPHEQARSENNPYYRGKRTPVGDDQVAWSVIWEDYEPATFTSKMVLDNGREKPEGGKWADPPEAKEVRGELEKRPTFENNGKIVFGDEGAPLNPRGRTGLAGRGLLGQWGPNHAADPIVTRREPLTGTVQVRRSGTEAALPSTTPTPYTPAPTRLLRPSHLATPAPPRVVPPCQVLAIKRKDTGEWALPGGMVKAGDSVSATVTKSINEVGNFTDPAKQKEFDSLVKVLFATGVDVYSGYVDDPRNTDNAWMETKAVHFHCTPELGEMLPLNIKKSKGKKNGDKGGHVGWIDCSKSLEPRYANMVRRHPPPPAWHHAAPPLLPRYQSFVAPLRGCRSCRPRLPRVAASHAVCQSHEVGG